MGNRPDLSGSAWRVSGKSGEHACLGLWESRGQVRHGRGTQPPWSRPAGWLGGQAGRGCSLRQMIRPMGLSVGKRYELAGEGQFGFGGRHPRMAGSTTPGVGGAAINSSFVPRSAGGATRPRSPRLLVLTPLVRAGFYWVAHLLAVPALTVASLGFFWDGPRCD